MLYMFSEKQKEVAVTRKCFKWKAKYRTHKSKGNETEIIFFLIKKIALNGTKFIFLKLNF